MSKVLQLGFIVASLAILPFATSCASHTRTVRTDVVTYPEGTGYHSEPSVVERRTTTTETADTGGCGGVLSCTVHVAGEVIALPFRAVGGLLSAIF